MGKKSKKEPTLSFFVKWEGGNNGTPGGGGQKEREESLLSILIEGECGFSRRLSCYQWARQGGGKLERRWRPCEGRSNKPFGKKKRKPSLQTLRGKGMHRPAKRRAY